MRALWIGLATLVVTATPALANGIAVTPGHLTTYAPTDLGGASIPTVGRGSQFAVACDGIKSSGADVRVVMSLANAPGDEPTGYSSVLQLNIGGRKLHFLYYFFAGSNNARFAFTCTCPAEDADHYDPLFKAAAKSFVAF